MYNFKPVVVLVVCAREGMAASAEQSASLLGTFSQQQTYKLFYNGSMLLWPFANLLWEKRERKRARERDALP